METRSEKSAEVIIAASLERRAEGGEGIGEARPCFARYADDCNGYVRSRKAGERVMALLHKCYAKLRLEVNEAKSAVFSVKGRKFLGYSFWYAKEGVKRRVADKPRAAFKQRIRQLTRCSGGRSMAEVIDKLKPYLLGW